MPGSDIDAVVFDLDGVIVDSEHVWDDARESLARERGGRWHEGAQQDMMGMSSVEWSRYMHDVIGLNDPPEEISAEVVRRLEATYREELPLIAFVADPDGYRIELIDGGEFPTPQDPAD